MQKFENEFEMILSNESTKNIQLYFLIIIKDVERVVLSVKIRVPYYY